MGSTSTFLRCPLYDRAEAAEDAVGCCSTAALILDPVSNLRYLHKRQPRFAQLFENFDFRRADFGTRHRKKRESNEGNGK